ncbi:MAG: class I SAM-dependent methyltransferase [Candidatus Omnitrophota bacterium]|nr:class I SAM-dependent methyltransferase [Candidatus Omnitrophota bacterium]
MTKKDNIQIYPEKTIEFFDSISEKYGEKNTTPELELKSNDLIADILLNSSNSFMILDAGCGNASFIKRIANNNKFHIIGIDFSSKMLEVGKRRLNRHNNVKFVQAVVENLPFKNNIFDRISLINISPTLLNKQQFLDTLKEIARVSLPYAKLYLNIWNSWNPILAIKCRRHDMENRPLKTYSSFNMNKLFKKASFKIKRKFYLADDKIDYGSLKRYKKWYKKLGQLIYLYLSRFFIFSPVIVFEAQVDKKYSNEKEVKK